VGGDRRLPDGEAAGARGGDRLHVEVEAVAEPRERQLGESPRAIKEVAAVEIGQGQGEDPPFELIEQPITSDLVARHPACARLSPGDA
jgi:hypothetical protein